MYEPLQFAPGVEALVRFVEETPPSDIVRETAERLQGGANPVDLIRAAALAVVRSTELPANHHGGAVHPIAGLHGCLQTALRHRGEAAWLPVVQHVAVCNHHVHSPQMGPYIMPKLEPRDGSVDRSYEVFKDLESASVHLGVDYAESASTHEEQLQETIGTLVSSIEGRRPVAAEQCLLWLLEHQSPGEVMDHILPYCIARNHLDDHNFIYPVLSAVALQDIGWEWARVLLRPVVRYHARHPSIITEGEPPDVPGRIEAAMQKHALHDAELGIETSHTETDTITSLVEQLSQASEFIEHIDLMAAALADGLSLQGAGEALSVAASTIFINAGYGNPMDSHLHTGATTRRFLIALPGVSQRNRVMALLSGITGPECLPSESRNISDSNSSRNQQTDDETRMVAAIVDCIESQPRINWRDSDRLDHLDAPPAAWDAVRLTRQYIEKGGDALPLFEALGQLIARDDFTELHGIKHFQTLYDEYHATRVELRDVHLLAMAKLVASVRSGKEQGVYEELRAVLH